MIKKIALLCLLIIASQTLAAVKIIHSYYKDYDDIIRIVFVLDQKTYYKTMMDVDNHQINLELQNTTKLKNMLPLKISSENKLIENVQFKQNKKEILINISCKSSYYAESFYLSGDRFKIVVDIYKNEIPENNEMVNNYLIFYEIVGFYDKAERLKRFIEKNPFKNQESSIKTTVIKQNVDNIPLVQDIQDLLAFKKPFLESDHLAYDWNNEAFELFDEIVQIFQKKLPESRFIIQQYKNSPQVDIAFLEQMSFDYNQLNTYPIKLNTIKVRTESLLNNTPQAQNVDYTSQMLRKLTLYIPDLQNEVSATLKTYQSILTQ